MHTTHHRRAAAALTVALLAGPVAFWVAAPAAWAQDTTTTDAVTTTTVAPTTTTTAPPTTTTTLAPTTTSTTHASTTTTHESTTTSSSTTTTTKPGTTSSSSNAWIWVVVAVVLVLAIVLVAFLIARSKRQGRELNWERGVRPAVAGAELARDLIQAQTEHDDPQRRAHVSQQVDEAVDALERVSAGAPDEISRAMTTRTAESLRGLAFAVEADHLLRSGGQSPTGDQLAAADAARRNRAAELEGNLRELKAAVTPPPPR